MKFLFTVELISFPSMPLSDFGTVSKFICIRSIKCLVINKNV
jgi:hypothetical protein